LGSKTLQSHHLIDPSFEKFQCKSFSSKNNRDQINFPATILFKNYVTKSRAKPFKNKMVLSSFVKEKDIHSTIFLFPHEITQFIESTFLKTEHNEKFNSIFKGIENQLKNSRYQGLDHKIISVIKPY